MEYVLKENIETKNSIVNKIKDLQVCATTECSDEGLSRELKTGKIFMHYHGSGSVWHFIYNDVWLHIALYEPDNILRNDDGWYDLTWDVMEDIHTQFFQIQNDMKVEGDIYQAAKELEQNFKDFLDNINL